MRPPAPDPAAIEFSFMTSTGPGGQNVNKVATGVRLSLRLADSGLPPGLLARLRRLAGRRVSGDGLLTITATRHRSQAANRRDALDRLEALIAEAAVPPRARKPTRPTRGSVERRLAAKGRDSRTKARRRRPDED
jgi:ribosome-associated protein